MENNRTTDYEEKYLNNYITDIDVHSNTFNNDNIVVEHRSKNPKRDFLFVNKKQGKHIPCSANEVISMCKGLAELVENKLKAKYGDDYSNKNILVVAFAETATAIGNIVADNISQCKYVIQTTRETIENSKQVLTFEEEHSHATTQFLLTYNDEREIELNEFDYILFIDDEISTGNTILNFINAFEKIKKNTDYGVASICNWQCDADRNKFESNNIDVFALITGKLKSTDIKMLDKSKDYTIINALEFTSRYSVGTSYTIRYVYDLGVYETERLGHKPNNDLSSIFKAIDKILNDDDNVIRIIGTEEFMYIPIKVGEYIENKYNRKVYCQATTRSSIDVFVNNEKSKVASSYENEIMSKYSVPSLYDDNRETYLYNLSTYVDKIIIICDKVPSGKFLSYIDGVFGGGGYARAVDIVCIM